MTRRSRSIVLALVAGLALGTPARSADPVAAEQQYRIARRLAAQGSPEAVAALAKVIELDPQGPLADDALLEQALLLGIPAWPEELGRLGRPSIGRGLELLEQVRGGLAHGDRAPEALVHRALLRLEPVAGYDPSAARLDLIAVATAKPASEWTHRARYALGWLHEQLGENERSLAAYHRVLIDDPRGPGIGRAWAGVGRLRLREGRFDLAARAFDLAVGGGVDDETLARPNRELAIRMVLLGAPGAPRTSPSTVSVPGIRTLGGLAPNGGGGVLLGDRRGGKVIALDQDGAAHGEWLLADVQLIAVDPHGRRYAATESGLHRLDAGGQAPIVATVPDEYAAPAAMAVDGTGGFWVVDRRGQRIGHLAPGQASPELFWESRSAKLQSLVWDGSRLLALDGRSRSIVAFDGAGNARNLVTLSLDRPAALAVDQARRLAVLDERAGRIALYHGDGTPIDTVDLASWQVGRAVGIGLGPDGALHLFDGSAATWIRQP